MEFTKRDVSYLYEQPCFHCKWSHINPIGLGLMCCLDSENCSRNPNRYENWQPDGCYTGILVEGQQAEQAKRGNCPHFTPLT